MKTFFFKENISNVRRQYFKLAFAIYFLGYGIDLIDYGLTTTLVDKSPLLNTWIGIGLVGHL